MLRAARRRFRWAARDIAAWVRREPRIPTPPRALIDGVGGGSWRAVGEDFLALMQDLGGLRPGDRVLDVGCGCGRMAAPLTNWLDGGGYEGFDIVEAAVRWCDAEITPRFPRFRFRVADIRNPLYRPDGAHAASAWTFPYADGSFDFVFLTSVFTHMRPEEQEHYVAEIARVLEDGGTCFATFFLWSDDAASRAATAPRGLRFAHAFEGYRAVYADNPEAALAIPEAEARARFERHGLVVEDRVYPGTWCRERGTTFQDVVVARRAKRVPPT